MTQVPPIRYSSAITTRAPYPAAMRAARTPPDPPPMTIRSTSKSAMLRSQPNSDFLAALAHFRAEFAIDDIRELLRPFVHVFHARFDRLGLLCDQLLPQRRLV